MDNHRRRVCKACQAVILHADADEKKWRMDPDSGQVRRVSEMSCRDGENKLAYLITGLTGVLLMFEDRFEFTSEQEDLRAEVRRILRGERARRDLVDVRATVPWRHADLAYRALGEA